MNKRSQDSYHPILFSSEKKNSDADAHEMKNATVFGNCVWEKSESKKYNICKDTSKDYSKVPSKGREAKKL